METVYKKNYICPLCNTLILRKNKAKHERTERHNLAYEIRRKLNNEIVMIDEIVNNQKPSLTQIANELRQKYYNKRNEPDDVSIISSFEQQQQLDNRLTYGNYIRGNRLY